MIAEIIANPALAAHACACCGRQADLPIGVREFAQALPQAVIWREKIRSTQKHLPTYDLPPVWGWHRCSGTCRGRSSPRAFASPALLRAVFLSARDAGIASREEIDISNAVQLWK